MLCEAIIGSFVGHRRGAKGEGETMKGNSLPEFTREDRRDDVMSAVTHGIGFLMAGAFLGLTLWKSIADLSARRIVAFSIYGACLLFTYLSSTLYHSFRQGRTKNFFRLMDHSSIFLCIAGAYTPIILVPYHGALMVSLLSVIWSLALVGILLKAVSFCWGGLNRTEIISVTLYLVMGWMSLALAPSLVMRVGWGFLLFILGGGLAYSAGVYFYAKESMRYNHTVWHLFILLASSLQFTGFFVYLT